MPSAKITYDPKDKSSIEAYAKRLLNHSLREFVDPEDIREFTGRGAFGQLVEYAYFHYEPNSKSEPDFPEAGVELKTSPLKRIRTGYSSKERLVFNIIDYTTEHAKTFEESSFWKKNKLLLLMLYLYEKGQDSLDHIFKFIELWKFPEEDMKIIRDDWEKIVAKIRAGKAHELSEGDTLYLGACTKGADRNSLRPQHGTDQLAMQRAYSLKSKYINSIIAQRDLDQKVEPIVKDISDYSPGETFEQYIIRRLSRFTNVGETEIRRRTNAKQSGAKHRFYLLTLGMLGVKGDKAEEFEKADLEIKTIKLTQTGRLKESMSFEQIKFEEIVHEEWEDSYWNDTVNKRFLFVVFQDNGIEYTFKKVFFWNMPPEDIEKAREFWEHTKAQIKADHFDAFYKSRPDRIFHVRPKARNSRDLMPTPSGRMEKKKAYWINRSYIMRLIDAR